MNGHGAPPGGLAPVLQSVSAERVTGIAVVSEGEGKEEALPVAVAVAVAERPPVPREGLRWSDRMEDRLSPLARVPRPVRAIAAWLVTFNFVCLGWVFFRATSFGNAIEVLHRLFSPSRTALDPVVVAVVVGALAVQFVPARWSGAIMAVFSRWSLLAQAAALGLMLVVIDVWGPAGVAPFIYFRF